MARAMTIVSLFGAVASVDDLQTQLQTKLDEVVASNLAEWPSLAMSFAYKDDSREVAVASGIVLDRSASTDDTFLYGSGTKPVTAAAVMRLIDRGLAAADDKAYVHLDPYLARMGRPSMEEYFGPEIQNATVLSLVRMSAGIRDFEDDFGFDYEVLGRGTEFWENYPYDAMNWSVSEQNVAAGEGGGPLICPANGNCSSYSSTSYEVAGLLLTALLAPESPWYEFDLASALFDVEDRGATPSMHFPTRGRMSDFLTVPGSSIDPDFSAEPLTIFDQDASILGFTCGNMVARPTDVARFFYWLLDEEGANEQPIISREAAAEMTTTQVLTKGWASGKLAYGAGIQDNKYGDGLFVKGHEGATYAFLSASGYALELGGGFSVIANTDGGNLPSDSACPLLEIVQRVITGDVNASLGCHTPRRRRRSAVDRQVGNEIIL